MLAFRFPMSKWHEVNSSKGFFDHIKKGHHVIFTAKFNNIKNKTAHSIESKSKVHQLKNATIDNGRILTADSYIVTLTEVDFEVYQKYYSWTSMEVIGYIYANVSDYIPRCALSTLIHNYVAKDTLKKAGKNYKIEKAKVNSEYGACVKSMHHHDILLDPETKTTYSIPTETSFEKFRDAQILLPQWGIYITSYARKRVLDAIYACSSDSIAGSDAVYCDTDSVKFLNKSNCAWFEEQNKIIEESNKEMCERLQIDYNIFHDLGCWDCESGESGYKYFKTLGAKRYIYTSEDGTNHVTVAGIPKGTVQKTYPDTFEMYDNFKDGMFIEVSGKLTPKYYDEERDEIITDYQGNSSHMHEFSSQTLEETEFTLTMDRNWIVNVIYAMQEVERRMK